MEFLEDLLAHTTQADFANVYEPAHDTFLLLDALDHVYGCGNTGGKSANCDAKRTSCRVVVEVGSGSGLVSAHVYKLFNRTDLCQFATDINPCAAELTDRTCRAAGASVKVVVTNFVDAVYDDISERVDLLIFNPPYVPTPDDEIGRFDISAAWAGGRNGRVVIDRFLPLVPKLLSPEGRCLLVLVDKNKPYEIFESLASQGFCSRIVKSRKVPGEKLIVAEIWRGPSGGQ